MWRAALRFSAVGLELGIAVAIGYAGGWYLDGQFGTKPYLSIVGLLFGVAAGGLTLVRVARELQQLSKNEDEGDNGNES
jgi:ATP synthase protein I